MSAFLLISATAPKKPISHNNSHSNSLAKKGRQSRGSSSPRQFENASTRASTKASTHSSVSGFSGSSQSNDSRNRSFFDPNKLTYVDYNSTFSLFERKLYEFNEEVARAKSESFASSVYLALNETMRDQGSLWTPDNLELLRYNYFEKFEPDRATVKASIRQNLPSYVHVISADERVDQMCRQNTTVDGHSHVLHTEGTRAKLAALERRLKCAITKSAEHSTSMRDALHLSSFWDDVYHDIRCESYSENYYEWLPPRETTQRLIVEVADLALYRVRMVTCAVSAEEALQLNGDERHELAKNRFFYFSGPDAMLLECLSKYMHDNFSRFVRDFVVCPNSGHVRELLAVVVACICDNLKLHFYGHSKSEEATDLFRDFLICAFDSVLVDFSVGQASPSMSSTEVFVRKTTNGAVTEKKRESGTNSKPIKAKKRFFSRFGI